MNPEKLLAYIKAELDHYMMIMADNSKKDFEKERGYQALVVLNTLEGLIMDGFFAYGPEDNDE